MAVFRIADKPGANGRKKDEEDARREERGKTSAEDRTVRPSPGKAWDTPTGGADPTPRNMSRGVGGHSMGGGTRNETAGGARELFRRTIEQQRRSAQADLTVQREQQRQLGQAAQGLYSAYARQREAQQNMNGAITAGMTGNPIAAATGLTTPELAKKIDKSRLLNLQRATDNENLATLLEAGRITVQSNSELWGIDTKWLVDWLDEKADEARQRSGKQRARVTEGFPGSEKAGRYLVAGAHAAEDLVFLKLTGVSPKVPRMLRTFANGVESAQRQGKDTRAQIKQGLVGMAGNYLLKTLLRGYSLDEQDRQTAETALETLGNNEALITAMDTASPEQMAELTDAVSRALDLVRDELIYGTGSGEKNWLFEQITKKITETLFDTAYPALPGQDSLDMGCKFSLDAVANEDEIIAQGKENEYIDSNRANLVDPALMEELSRSGVRYTPENVRMVTKDKEGKLMWLETGDDFSGETHILRRHKKELAQRGIDDISSVLKELISGEPLQKGANHRGRYAIFQYNENEYKVIYGTNGYIVSFYPCEQ